MNTITIDLSIPENAKAFADCEVGDTKILTVQEKEEGGELLATVEKGEYASDEEAPVEGEIAEEAAPAAAPVMTGPPPKGVTVKARY